MFGIDDTPAHPLDAVFRPQTIAVIGASADPEKLGHHVLRSLFLGEFEGRVYPVNPNAAQVMCVRSYASVRDIPEGVELAYLCVPRGLVPQIAEECGDAGVRALVVATGGFRDGSVQARELSARLAAVGRRARMRIIGPASLGVVNTDPAVHLQGTYAPTAPLPGSVSLFTQIGPTAARVFESARRAEVGLRMFLCAGDRSDVGTTEILEYFGDDTGTRVIGLAMRSFGEPRVFPTVAREVARRKPILVVKPQPASGELDPSVATGVPEAPVRTGELLAQCGLLRVDDVSHLLDVAQAFSTQPLTAGPRVAILSNVPEAGACALESARELGLEPAELDRDTVARTRALLAQPGDKGNPLLLPPNVGGETIRAALDAVLDDEDVDAAIVIVLEPWTHNVRNAAAGIADVAARRRSKPLLVCYQPAFDEARIGLLRAQQLPVYDQPEAAVRALATMERYRRWVQRPAGAVARFDVDTDTARAILERRRARGGGAMSEVEVSAILEAYGIPVPRSARCTTAEEAVAASEELGYPVVMKLAHEDIIHKSAIGGVILGPSNELEVRGAFAKLASVAFAHVGGNEPSILVQEYVRGGTETRLGMSDHPEFGPLVRFGLGGRQGAVLADQVFRVTPVTDTEAREMVLGVRGRRLLDGTLGGPPVDDELLVEMLQRVGQLVTDLPLVKALDIDPFVTFPDSSRGVAVDAQIRVVSAAEELLGADAD